MLLLLFWKRRTRPKGDLSSASFWQRSIHLLSKIGHSNKLFRGPEVEYWVGPDGDKSGIWPYLPFQSLPDGSHSHEENFCYFTLLYDEENKCAPSPVSSKDEEGNVVEKPNMDNVTTLFGIACNRQVRVSEIRNMTSDISRSTVQKSVVVVARKPIFGPIKEKLAVVTRAYFMQGDFEDRQIIDNLYENLVQIFSHKLDESDLNIGMPLRELIYRLGQSVLVILKALLLEKRVLFFASNTELLCASQFSLVSLIPNLISHLEDCGSPLLSKYETTLKKPTSLRTSDRNSLLTFMGLPLQIFADGGVFSPYVPLQQLDEIKSDETRYFMIGSTNSLLLSPKQEIADVVVNMDEDNVQILNTDYKSALTLSASDKKWMDTVVKAVADSWDEEDPWRPKGLGFTGSEDYIRVQFEDYIINLLASVKYDSFLTKRAHQPHMVRSNIEGNPIKLYNMEWVEEWQKTNNYRIFNKFTDEEIFDIVEPKHMASSPTNIDVQRQLIEPKAVEEERKAQQAQQAASGGITKSVTRVFSSFWSEKSPSTANTNGSSQSPKSQSSSRISSPKPSLGTHTPGQESQDRVSLAESIKTAVTNGSNDTTATNSETESGSTKEGYFAGWSRWAASKRRQLAKSTVSVNSTASTESKTDQKE
ncbi:hypothetical protein TRICI_001814 [Trichomonascus ciferrii]|uniref:UDENN domain-containing protein n=1 Tax=Trichomonascus ciferrii TaxID=44093 RepID=A0A642V8G9_9ASCO|nr:hypothetical protein TRICI_001814 [Trichomonascus ciferrii]